MHDLCTHTGALRVKEQIESYWQARGYDVTVRLEEAGFVPAMRTRRHDVRSDMVNGWPVQAAKDARHG